MSRWIDLHTGHGDVRAWLAQPEQASRGAVIVVQEIFGANAHIRSVANRYARDGFTAMAPSFFDPVQAGVELGYEDADFARGRMLVDKLGFDATLEIVGAASRWLREAGHAVGIVGFCWGGTVALLANARHGLPAVSYYGARNVQFLHESAAAPLMFHFGTDDASIPPDAIDRHRLHQPQAALHLYPAGHAFNRDVDPRHHDAQSAELAHQRSLEFFREHLK